PDGPADPYHQGPPELGLVRGLQPRWQTPRQRQLRQDDTSATGVDGPVAHSMPLAYRRAGCTAFQSVGKTLPWVERDAAARLPPGRFFAAKTRKRWRSARRRSTIRRIPQPTRPVPDVP